MPKQNYYRCSLVAALVAATSFTTGCAYELGGALTEDWTEVQAEVRLDDTDKTEDPGYGYESNDRKPAIQDIDVILNVDGPERLRPLEGVQEVIVVLNDDDEEANRLLPHDIQGMKVVFKDNERKPLPQPKALTVNFSDFEREVPSPADDIQVATVILKSSDPNRKVEILPATVILKSSDPNRKVIDPNRKVKRPLCNPFLSDERNDPNRKVIDPNRKVKVQPATEILKSNDPNRKVIDPNRKVERPLCNPFLSDAGPERQN